MRPDDQQADGARASRDQQRSWEAVAALSTIRRNVQATARKAGPLQRLKTELIQLHDECSRLIVSDGEQKTTTGHTQALVKPPEIGIISYAQNFEDVMLWRALGRVPNGCYIDVGAWDPVIDSVSKAFYDHGWRGIHIEPVSEQAEALRRARPDEIVIEALLGATLGEREFYLIPTTGLSTACPGFAEQHRQSGWAVESQTLPVTTLAYVFDQVGPHPIHWLKIDVEGMENEVLTGWGDHPKRPWILVVEATAPMSQIPSWTDWEEQLLSRDYQFVYFDGLNRFYLHADHCELFPLMQTPPNIFDTFSRHVPDHRPERKT